MGDLGQARTYAAEISSPASRIQVLCNLVVDGVALYGREVADDLLDEASDLTRTLTRRAERHQAKGRLAAAHAALGKFETALRHASEIELGYTHAFAISRIAIAIGETDALDRAVSLAKSVSDERLRVDTLLTIARARHVLGDDAGAEQVGHEVRDAAENIRNSLDRTSVLADLAIAEAYAGRDGDVLFDLAITELRDMTDPWARARMLAKAATTLFALRGL